MELVALAAVAVAFLGYAVVSGKLEGTVLTAPLLFAGFGFLIGGGGLDIAEADLGHSFLHIVAELTLILVLFADAARIDLKRVRQDHNLPLRMLILGLPLAIAFGTVVAVQLFPQFTLWEAALLAALLAPTDAALGQAVVSNPAVPVRIRQAINIESGLNDGIALPAVLLFAALAAMSGEGESQNWVTFGLLQIGLGPVAGIAVGWIGGKLIERASRAGAISESFQGIGILALAGLSYVGAELIGGNGFIAAFVGGMVFGNVIQDDCDFLFEFMETEGQLLMLITFLVFGMALLPEGLEGLSFMHVVYALLSLTVIRMLPIAISLVGSGVKVPTIAFLGWFGPRGLASILFVLLILDDAEVVNEAAILSITVATVALSTLLHGVTAAPFAAAYGRLAKRAGDCEETKPVSDLPLREGLMQEQ